MSGKYFIKRIDLLHEVGTKRYSVYSVGGYLSALGASVNNWGKTFPGFGDHSISFINGQCKLIKANTGPSGLCSLADKTVHKKELKGYQKLPSETVFETDDREAFVANVVFMFGTDMGPEIVNHMRLGPAMEGSAPVDISMSDEEDLRTEPEPVVEPDRGPTWGSW